MTDNRLTIDDGSRFIYIKFTMKKRLSNQNFIRKIALKMNFNKTFTAIHNSQAWNSDVHKYKYKSVSMKQKIKKYATTTGEFETPIQNRICK